jgi:hypothetical protein
LFPACRKISAEFARTTSLTEPGLLAISTTVPRLQSEGERVREGNKGRELEYEKLRYEDWMEKRRKEYKNLKEVRKKGKATKKEVNETEQKMRSERGGKKVN